MKKLFLLFPMIVFWGCSSQKMNQVPKQFQNLKNLTVFPADARPEESISFKKDAVYGSTKNVMIGQIGSVAVDSSGRVYLADIQENIIDVFDPDGHFITHICRKGRGPGEFGIINSMQIKRGHLYVYDSNELKESIFTLHPPALRNTILLAGNRDKYPALHSAWPWIEHLYVRNNNTYLAEFISSVVSSNKDNPQKYPKQWQNYSTKGLFYLLDKNGNVSSKEMLKVKNDTRTVVLNHTGGIPFVFLFGRCWTVLSSNNNIYQAEPDYLLIKVYSPNGFYLHAFYYPHPRVPLTAKSASEAGLPDIRIREMKLMNLPPNWPVLMIMRIDDKDRLWVATIVKNMKVYQWWVLNSNGKLLARFTWPRSKTIVKVKYGHVYTAETNKKTEMSRIVRYRITTKSLASHSTVSF